MSGYYELEKYLGKHEVRDNHVLRKFLSSYGSINDIDPATTAWCAAAVNSAEKQAGKEGTGMLNARSYLRYGKCIYDRDRKIGYITNASKGDIVVFERGGSTWMGHVAYFDGFDEADDGTLLIRTLGGNQSDSVSIGWYRVNRLLAVRRP